MHRATKQGWLAFQAFLSGVGVTNPYQRGSLENRNWWYGWEGAADAEETSFNERMDGLNQYDIPSKGDGKITETSDDCGC